MLISDIKIASYLGGNCPEKGRGKIKFTSKYGGE
jgi:hypothetical protein